MAAADAQVIDAGRTSLRLVDVTKLKEIRDPVVQEAEALAIASQADLELAGAFLTERIKPILKQISESCDPVVAAAHSAHKAATAQRNALQQPLLEAETLIKRKIGAYLDAEEKKRRAEIARQDAERRRAAEEEQLRRAAAEEAAGNAEAADRVLEEEPMQSLPPAPPPPAPPQKVAGVSARKRFKAEVTDLAALVRDIASGRAPISLVQVNQSKLNQQVQALDGQVNYAGVRVYEDRVVSARAR